MKEIWLTLGEGWKPCLPTLFLTSSTSLRPIPRCLNLTEIANMNPGVVEARMSAEAVSTTFFHCVLKGLHKSPKIITDPDVFHYDDIISAKDVSCLVIPDGCLGLPTLAALEQGIKVVAVKENKNLMKNDLNELPWDTGQFIQSGKLFGSCRSFKLY